MRYHLIGIAGSSMSGLARILQKRGEQVSGCDLEEIYLKGILTQKGHNPTHINKNIDALVTSAAITPSSLAWPEVEKAQQLGVKVISRAKMIGQLMREKRGIAIAGTHGKTTISAMVTLILKEAGRRPSFLIGGEIKGWGNADWDEGEDFVVEACEYGRQFLEFRPVVALISNIEKEHLDTYPRGMPEIKKAFKKFVRLLPKNGLLILWQEEPLTGWLKKSAPCKVKTFSLSKPWPGLSLKIPGEHNLLNATAAARLCHELGVPHSVIKKTLNQFTGVKRRFEIKGEAKGILVVDDYGHHPSEIKATLKGARQWYPSRRIICLFQPHQYARTYHLLKDFTTAFSDCDLLIVTDIFGVPGRDEVKVTTEELVKAIRQKKKEVIYLKEEQLLDYLKQICKSNDLVLTMGATKIYQVGEQFLSFLKKGEQDERA